jgi:hypothetical protein
MSGIQNIDIENVHSGKMQYVTGIKKYEKY